MQANESREQPGADGSSSGATASTSSSANVDGNSSQDSFFECNICLDTAKDAVVSLCGHLFCWPCLHRWLETKPNRQVCPVCKAAICKDKVIPLYGRGGSKEDPRDKLPPRPQGQRSEPENNSAQTFPGFGFTDGGFHMSFGIGAFPFGIFASTFNFGETRPAPAPGTPGYEEDQFISKLFLWIAVLFIVWLIFA